MIVLREVRRLAPSGAVALAALACADVRAPRAPGADPSERDGAAIAAPPAAARDAPAAASGPIARGRASFYSDKLAGRSTASGEPYDPRALTAAHRTLALGTWIVVARPDGRSVRVRVNDRGPFGDSSRIVDLSRRAAEELGMIREGVVDVTVTVVPSP